MKKRTVTLILLLLPLFYFKIASAEIVVEAYFSSIKIDSLGGEFQDIQSALDFVGTSIRDFDVASTGTLTLLAKDNKVTGDGGTSFNGAKPGHLIQIGNSPWRYPIHTITDNHNLELMSGNIEGDFIDATYQIYNPVEYIVKIPAGAHELHNPLVIPDKYFITLEGMGLETEDTLIYGIFSNFNGNVEPNNPMQGSNLVLLTPQGSLTIKNLHFRALSKYPETTPVEPGVAILFDLKPPGQEATALFKMENSILSSEVIGDLLNLTASSVEIINSKLFNYGDSVVANTDNLLIEDTKFQHHIGGSHILVAGLRGEHQAHRPWIIRNTTFSADPDRVQPQYAEGATVSFGNNDTNVAFSTPKTVLIESTDSIAYSVGKKAFAGSLGEPYNIYSVNFTSSTGDIINYCQTVTVDPPGSMNVTNVTGNCLP